jgi:hypothetical protein
MLMNNYVVEFVEVYGAEHPIFEYVLASSAEDAKYSIEIGWPKAEIIGVYQQVWFPQDKHEIPLNGWKNAN